MQLRVPRRRSSALNSFARELRASKIDFIDRSPVPNSDIANCFNNVRRQIHVSGGCAVIGWAIREWPKVFLEAQQHCVWDSGTKLVDVTPHQFGEKYTTFIQDDTYQFDEAGLATEVNSYFVTAHGEVKLLAQQLIDVTTEKMKLEIENKLASNGLLTIETISSREDRLLEQMKSIAQAIEWKLQSE